MDPLGVVQRLADTIDPAPAQSLDHGLLPIDRGRGGGLFVVEEPDFRRILMGFEPVVPVGGGGEGDGVGQRQSSKISVSQYEVVLSVPM